MLPRSTEDRFSLLLRAAPAERAAALRLAELVLDALEAESRSQREEVKRWEP